MQNIIPRSQEGFDLVVDFVLDNGDTRTEKVSVKPYYSDGKEMVESVSRDGIVYRDKKGNPIMEARKIQVWSDPAADLTEFLTKYGEALERGLQVEQAPTIAPEFFGKAI